MPNRTSRKSKPTKDSGTSISGTLMALYTTFLHLVWDVCWRSGFQKGPIAVFAGKMRRAR